MARDFDAIFEVLSKKNLSPEDIAGIQAKFADIDRFSQAEKRIITEFFREQEFARDEDYDYETQTPKPEFDDFRVRGLPFEGDGFFYQDRQGNYRPFNPRTGDRFLNERIRNLKLFSTQSEKDVSFSASLGIAEIVAEAIRNATRELKGALRNFEKGLAYIADRGKGVANINKEVGALAQLAIVNKYREERASGGPVYRQGQERFSGGKLLAALSSNQFFLANRDGIQFINTAMLDTRAKQWYRYNYGVGQKATTRPKDFQIRLFGSRGGKFGLSRYGPSKGKPLILPGGIWLGPGGFPDRPNSQRNEFWTSKLYKTRPGFGVGRPTTRREGKTILGDPKTFSPRFSGPILTEGIRGHQIFDAGTMVLATELPKRYEALIRQWFIDAKEGTAGGRFGPLGPGKANIDLKTASDNLATLNRRGTPTFRVFPD